MDAQQVIANEAAARVAAVQAEIRRAESQIDLLHERLGVLRSTLADTMAAMRMIATPLPLPLPEADPPEQGKHGEVRAQVVAVLRAAYPGRVTAAEIRRQAEARLGFKVHPKTPSMTLNRLKREGLAARYGRQWVFIPPQPAA